MALTLCCAVWSDALLNWTLRITWWWMLWGKGCSNLCSIWLWTWALSTCREDVIMACLVLLTSSSYVSSIHWLSSTTHCSHVVYFSRLQCFSQVLWPISAQEPGRARSGPEQQRPGPQAAGALWHTRQHRCLAGRRGRAICPGRSCWASVCLPHCKTVPEDPPGWQVSM